jgi:hypothetical protein
MAALHPTPTPAAATNLDGKRADDRADDGEIFLVLPRGAGVAQAPETVRARVRQRCAMAFGDLTRNRAVGFASICPTGATTGPARRARRRPARERSGLSVHLPPRVVELVLESVDLLAEGVPLLAVPIPIAIRALVLAPQPLDLALFSLELRDQLVTRRGAPSRIHGACYATIVDEVQEGMREHSAPPTAVTVGDPLNEYEVRRLKLKSESDDF